MIPLKSSTGEKKKKNQGSRASLVIHNNSRVSSPRLITLGVSCNARDRRSVFELVRLSSQADENELAEEDTYSRLSVVRVRACVRAREEREKSSRTRPSGRKNLKRAQQPSSRDRSTRKKQRGRRREPCVLEIARPDNFRNVYTAPPAAPRMPNCGFDTRKEHNERRVVFCRSTYLRFTLH